MSIVWRGQTKSPIKRQRKSALKHPVQLSKGMTLYFTDEGMEQLRTANFLRAHNIDFIHIPNESKRSRLEMISLKLLGLTPGACDILIWDTPPKYPDKKGIAIEMKSKNGKVTDLQAQFQAKLVQKGWLTSVCYGADQAIKCLKEAGYALNCRCPYCRD